jgi:uncharacterized tellurite resistance protein B-like protein
MIDITADLKGHFLRLYQMALSDEEFHPLELKMLYQFAEDRSIPHTELDKLLMGHSGSISIPESMEQRVEYLYDLCQMIWADGEVSLDEEHMLRKYCRKFEFQEENINELATYLLENVKKGMPKAELIETIKNA